MSLITRPDGMDYLKRPNSTRHHTTSAVTVTDYRSQWPKSDADITQKPAPRTSHGFFPYFHISFNSSTSVFFHFTLPQGPTSLLLLYMNDPPSPKSQPPPSPAQPPLFLFSVSLWIINRSFLLRVLVESTSNV